MTLLGNFPTAAEALAAIAAEGLYRVQGEPDGSYTVWVDPPDPEDFGEFATEQQN